MDELAVGFEALVEAEQAMRHTVQQVDGLLADLAEYLKPMTAAWTGAAAEAFQRRKAEWDAAVEDQQRQMAALHGLVVTAHDNHADAVRTNQRIWPVGR